MTVCSKQIERAESARILVCRLLNVPDDTPLEDILTEIDKHPDTDVAGTRYLISEVLAPLTENDECCECEDEEFVVEKSNN